MRDARRRLTMVSRGVRGGDAHAAPPHGGWCECAVLSEGRVRPRLTGSAGEADSCEAHGEKDDDDDDRLSLLSSAVATSADSELEFAAGEDYAARWVHRAPARGQAQQEHEAERAPPPPPPPAQRTTKTGGGAKSAAAAARWEAEVGGAAFSDMAWTLQA